MGLELQFGTNYLSHFALTAQLLPLLQKVTPHASSTCPVSQRAKARLNFDDLQAERNYKPIPVYAQSKLASLLLLSSSRGRSTAAGVGYHQHRGPPGHLAHRPADQRTRRAEYVRIDAQVALVSVPASRTRRAAHVVRGNIASGQARRVLWPETRSTKREGYPSLAKTPTQARDTAVAARLWEVSEQLVGVRFVPAGNTAEAVHSLLA